MLHTELNSLKRPSLLLNAARSAVGSCSIDALLQRLTNFGLIQNKRNPWRDLMNFEREQDHMRRQASPSYSVALHIECLVALMVLATKQIECD